LLNYAWAAASGPPPVSMIGSPSPAEGLVARWRPRWMRYEPGGARTRHEPVHLASLSSEPDRRQAAVTGGGRTRARVRSARSPAPSRAARVREEVARLELAGGGRGTAGASVRGAFAGLGDAKSAVQNAGGKMQVVKLSSDGSGRRGSGRHDGSSSGSGDGSGSVSGSGSRTGSGDGSGSGQGDRHQDSGGTGSPGAGSGSGDGGAGSDTSGGRDGGSGSGSGSGSGDGGLGSGDGGGSGSSGSGDGGGKAVIPALTGGSQGDSAPVVRGTEGVHHDRRAVVDLTLLFRLLSRPRRARVGGPPRPG
jgi:hypothetical protein